MAQTLLFTDKDRLKNRPASKKEIDVKALHTLVQAAVNVELFTIPLYMTSLYSLQGMHEINSRGTKFYEGRIWPGMSASAKTKSSNQLAFNAVFSVFVAEMLHLQIISNLAKVVGYDPKFTCDPLQDEKTFAWKCYSPDSTELPGILDFRDTIGSSKNIKVKLGPMNMEQMELFLAIEQTEKDAKSIIPVDIFQEKYSAEAPYENWKEGDSLPYFGSIGNMYLQLWNYLSIIYDDGTRLWDIVFDMGLAKGKKDSTSHGSNEAIKGAMQREVFNPGRLNPIDDGENEYPAMPTSIVTTDRDRALYEVLNMINGITDQGEGGGVVDEILERVRKTQNLAVPLTLMAVKNQFRPSCPVLRDKYPSYTASGNLTDSAKANARGLFGDMDHFETFEFVKTLIRSGGITTWDQWHAEGNVWTAEMLQTDAYRPDPGSKLPKPEAIAGALNRLKQNDVGNKNYDLFSRTASGAIYGVTKVLNDYFKNPNTDFPFPSMGGSGDRMSICWAVFGKIPDLTKGIRADDEKPLDRNSHLYHACQGLNLDENPDAGSNLESCAPGQLFHACKGSNDCKAEGGCGFVQSTAGGSGCGGVSPKPVSGLPFSPPSDNACGGFGGCAVPMSASQIYPPLKVGQKYEMQLFNFGKGLEHKAEAFAIMPYNTGELVYDVAWRAYTEVLKKRGVPVPEPPAPSDLRLAFPPST